MESNGSNWLYTQPRLYDRLFKDFDDDIPFYRKLIASTGGPALDLMCGTGRVTIPLAQQDYNLSGLDNSPNMLAVARENAGRLNKEIDWIEADARDFKLNRQYRLIFIPFTSFLQFIEPDDMTACLRSVHANLHPEGRFVVDIFNPDLKILSRSPDEPSPIDEIDDCDGKGRVIITETSQYDRAAQVMQVNWHYRFTDTGEKQTGSFFLRIIYPRELDAMLNQAGFDIEHKYGNYDFSEFVSDSPKQLPVCRPRHLS